MKTINITCASCGNISFKPKNEINRQIKRGRTKFYCNRACAGKEKNNIQRLKQFKDNFKKVKYIRQPDELSSFRWYMKIVRKSSKKRNHSYDIDSKYLQALWIQQDGKCPITKQKLELRTHSYKNKSHPYSASLDRIDNDKGYTKGNVRFVALIFNYARNTFEDQDVIDFCHKVVKNIED